VELPEIDPLAVEPPAKARPSSFAWLWPDITNEVEAKKATRSGAYAAVIVAVLTAAISLIAIGSKKPLMGMDGWGMVDALLFAVIAWRVFKFSFPWAVAGLLLYGVETFWRWSTVGVPKGAGIITTGFLILAFITGARGTAFLNKAKSC
jgi:hypothetical protein